MSNPALRIIDRQMIDQAAADRHHGNRRHGPPIGRGQRELIHRRPSDRQNRPGDHDAILNQRDKQVYCVYVAIGPEDVDGGVGCTTFCSDPGRDGILHPWMVASASATASLQYIAPYAGCAMAEELK
jgi:F-type H+-transporting ATPase subunit alpha